MINNVELNFFRDWWKDTLQAGRESYGHTIQSVAARSIAHKFLQHFPGMHQAWKIIIGFIVWFTFGLDQSKIKFYTETEKVILENVNHHREGIYTSYWGGPVDRGVYF